VFAAGFAEENSCCRSLKKKVEERKRGRKKMERVASLNRRAVTWFLFSTNSFARPHWLVIKSLSLRGLAGFSSSSLQSYGALQAHADPLRVQARRSSNRR
jgi:hypothetical protein